MSMQGLGRGLGQGLASLGQMMMQERAADKQRLADEEAWAKRFGMQQQAVNDRVQAERDYNNEMVPVYGGSVSPVVGPMMVPREEAAQTRQNLFRMFADSVAADRAAAARKFDPNNDPAIQRAIWERNNPAAAQEYDPRTDPGVQRELALEALGLGRYANQGQAAYDPVYDEVLQRELERQRRGLGQYADKPVDKSLEYSRNLQNAARERDAYVAELPASPAYSFLYNTGNDAEFANRFIEALRASGGDASAAADSAFGARDLALPEGYTTKYDSRGRLEGVYKDGRKFLFWGGDNAVDTPDEINNLVRLIMMSGGGAPARAAGVAAQDSLSEDWMR